MNSRLKDWRVLLGAVLVITGLDLLLMVSKLPRYVGVLFLLPGALILLYVFRDDINSLSSEDKYGLAEDRYVPIISKLTVDGALVKLFPLAGFLAISLDLFLNHGNRLGSFDTIILLWGVMMIVYPYVPNKLYRERDFVLLFLETGDQCLNGGQLFVQRLAVGLQTGQTRILRVQVTGQGDQRLPIRLSVLLNRNERGGQRVQLLMLGAGIFL